jgi:RNA recognition motif-containing protein
MSFTVFLGNLPLWVTADDIKSWLTAENLVADNVKVIRNPETQESKGFAFIDSPNADEMNAIIRRFDRAPLEDRLLRANPAQPPKGKGDKSIAPSRGPMGAPPPAMAGSGGGGGSSAGAGTGGATSAPTGMVGGQMSERRRSAMAGGATAAPARDNKDRGERKKKPSGPPSAFAEELAKAL